MPAHGFSAFHRKLVKGIKAQDIIFMYWKLKNTLQLTFLKNCIIRTILFNGNYQIYKESFQFFHSLTFHKSNANINYI